MNTTSSKLKYIKSNQGFGIIEAVMAAAILMIVMFSVVSLVTNNQKSVRGTELSLDINQFGIEITQALGNEESCKLNLTSGYMSTDTFNSATLASVVIPIAKLRAGNATTSNDIAVNNAPLANYPKIIASNMRVSDFVDLSPASAPKSRYLAKLSVHYTKTGDVLGVKEVTRNYSAVFKTSPLPGTMVKIDSCTMGKNLDTSVGAPTSGIGILTVSTTATIQPTTPACDISSSTHPNDVVAGKVICAKSVPECYFSVGATNYMMKCDGDAVLYSPAAGAGAGAGG